MRRLKPIAEFFNSSLSRISIVFGACKLRRLNQIEYLSISSLQLLTKLILQTKHFLRFKSRENCSLFYRQSES